MFVVLIGISSSICHTPVVSLKSSLLVPSFLGIPIRIPTTTTSILIIHLIVILIYTTASIHKSISLLIVSLPSGIVRLLKEVW